MKRGFTLIELLIVISILMAISGLFTGYSALLHRQHALAQWQLETQQAIAHLEQKTRAETANLVAVRPLENPATLGLELRNAEGKIRHRVLAVTDEGLVLLAGEQGETFVERLGRADEIELVPYRVKERPGDETFREGFFVRLYYHQWGRVRAHTIHHEFFVGRRLS